MLLIEKKGNSLIYPTFIKINEEKSIQTSTFFEFTLDNLNYFVLVLKIFENEYLFHSSAGSPILLFFWRKEGDIFKFEHSENNFEKTTEIGSLANQLNTHVSKNELSIEQVIQLYRNLFLVEYFGENRIIYKHDFDLVNFDYDIAKFKKYLKEFSTDKLYLS
jgi:hypothetical protein